MSEEKIREAIQLCDEALNLIKSKRGNFSLSSELSNTETNSFSLESFIGWLDLEISELKDLIDKYDSIDAEPMSIEEIKKRYEELKLKIEKINNKNT